MNQLTSTSTTLKKTMVVCDTQPIAVQGMRALVAERQDFVVTGEANSLVAGMELVRNLSPAVLVVDKSFGLQPVIDWVANVRSNGRSTAAVVWGHAISPLVSRNGNPVRMLLKDFCLLPCGGGELLNFSDGRPGEFSSRCGQPTHIEHSLRSSGLLSVIA